MVVRLVAGGSLAGAAAVGASPASAPHHPAAEDSVPRAPGTITLSQVLELAAAHDPRLARAGWRLRAAERRSADAGRMPNPSVEGAVENWGGGLGSGRVETTVSLSQPIEIGGDRRARAFGARAEIDAARAESALELRNQLAQATSDFVEAWTAQERIGCLLGWRQMAADAAAAAAERVKAGAASPVERIRAQGRVALAEAELARARADFAAACRAVAQRWGASEAAFDSLVLPAPDLSPPPGPDSLLATLEDHPELGRAAAEARAAEATWLGARAARTPDLEARFGVRHLRDAGGTGWVSGVSIPLPLWNRRSGAVGAADAERSRARLELETTRRRIGAELRSTVDHLRASIAAFELVRDRAAPAAEGALAELRSGYRAGRLGYVDLVDGQRGAIAARLAAIEAAAEVWRFRAELHRLVGAAERGGER
jgi:cobalt-zinc-cadmium efflux system outer membrane protein